METIKIIDLLKRMEKGIGIPKKIIYNFYTYEYHEEQNDYFNKNVGYLFDKYNVSGLLKDTVVIIEDTPEEDKKIEELSTWFAISDTHGLDVLCKYIDHNTEMFYDKINELVRKVNGE